MIFNKDAWARRETSRGRGSNAEFLLADLLCTRNLIGMSREQIVELLGKPGLERFHKFLNLDRDSVLYDCNLLSLELNYYENNASFLRTILVIAGCTKQFFDYSDDAWIEDVIHD